VGSIKAPDVNDRITGAVHLYHVDMSTPVLEPIGFQTIYGEQVNSDFGNSVALSDDGTLLLVGSRFENGNSAGAMHIYNLLNGSFVQRGVIEGRPKDQTGWSVAVSGDGQVIAVGATGQNRGAGVVMSFKSPNWTPYGSIIGGVAKGDLTGFSLALNYDGSILAVGSRKADNPPQNKKGGNTIVYGIDKNVGVWVIRDTISSIDKNAADSSSLALSNNGKVLVVGVKSFHYAGKIQPGRCWIFESDGVGQKFTGLHSIFGDVEKEQMGHSAAISADGNLIACGGMGGMWKDGDTKSGVIKIWNRVAGEEMSLWADGDKSTVEGGSLGSSLSFSADGSMLLAGAYSWTRQAGNAKTGAIQLFKFEWERNGPSKIPG